MNPADLNMAQTVFYVGVPVYVSSWMYELYGTFVILVMTPSYYVIILKILRWYWLLILFINHYFLTFLLSKILVHSGVKVKVRNCPLSWSTLYNLNELLRRGNNSGTTSTTPLIRVEDHSISFSEKIPWTHLCMLKIFLFWTFLKFLSTVRKWRKRN